MKQNIILDFAKYKTILASSTKKNQLNYNNNN